MDFRDRKKAEDEIRRQQNAKLTRQLNGKWGELAPTREYGPKLTKKEWEQTKTELTAMKNELQRALWYAQALGESEEQKSIEDGLTLLKQYLENVMTRMRV